MKRSAVPELGAAETKFGPWMCGLSSGPDYPNSAWGDREMLKNHGTHHPHSRASETTPIPLHRWGN